MTVSVYGGTVTVTAVCVCAKTCFVACAPSVSWVSSGAGWEQWTEGTSRLLSDLPCAATSITFYTKCTYSARAEAKSSKLQADNCLLLLLSDRTLHLITEGASSSLRKKLISTTCVRDLVLLIMAIDHLSVGCVASMFLKP